MPRILGVDRPSEGNKNNDRLGEIHAMHHKKTIHKIIHFGGGYMETMSQDQMGNSR